MCGNKGSKRVVDVRVPKYLAAFFPCYLARTLSERSDLLMELDRPNPMVGEIGPYAAPVAC